MIKQGFHPLKNANETSVAYAKYYLVPGLWVDKKQEQPQPCWGVFTPDKKLLGFNHRFLDAKERVKIHKISKFSKNNS